MCVICVGLIRKGENEDWPSCRPQKQRVSHSPPGYTAGPGTSTWLGLEFGIYSGCDVQEKTWPGTGLREAKGTSFTTTSPWALDLNRSSTQTQKPAHQWRVGNRRWAWVSLWQEGYWESPTPNSYGTTMPLKKKLPKIWKQLKRLLSRCHTLTECYPSWIQGPFWIPTRCLIHIPFPSFFLVLYSTLLMPTCPCAQVLRVDVRTRRGKDHQ